MLERGAVGRYWYQQSLNNIERYAGKVGEPVSYVCDVLAILSPRVQVSRNVRMMRDYIERGEYTQGMMQARRKALEYYETWGIYSGKKVTAFSKALQAGGGDHAVIDAWVFRAFDLEVSKANYKVAVSKLQRTSKRVGWPVAETQAALWVGCRSLCGFTNHSPITID